MRHSMADILTSWFASPRRSTVTDIARRPTFSWRGDLEGGKEARDWGEEERKEATSRKVAFVG